MREGNETDYLVELVLLHRDMGMEIDDDECNSIIAKLRASDSPHLRLPRDQVEKFNRCLKEFNRIKYSIN
uniref:Uncharacterized protein n=1 Tax=viral metagenome TaxID=1070528 RepID=A0A6M3LN52_9ZZZZ